MNNLKLNFNEENAKIKTNLIQQQINEVIQPLFNSRKRESNCVFCYELFMGGDINADKKIYHGNQGKEKFNSQCTCALVLNFLTISISSLELY